MRAGWIGSASAPSSSASRSAAARRPCPGASPTQRRPVRASAPRSTAGLQAVEDRGQVAGHRRRRASACAGDLAGGVGDVHDLRGRRLRPCRRRRRSRAGSPAACRPRRPGRPPPSARAAGLGDQQRVAAGHDAAAHAVGERRDAERPRRSAARPPRRRRPTRRCRGSAPGGRRRRAGRRSRSSASGSGSAPRERADGRAPGPRRELKNSSIGTSTNTGPRCGDAGGGERLVHAAEHVAGGREGARPAWRPTRRSAAGRAPGGCRCPSGSAARGRRRRPSASRRTGPARWR